MALVTTGAGSTNAITGVAAAWMDRVPLLVISGNESSRYIDAPVRVWGTQGYDSSRTVDKMCKETARLHPKDNWFLKLDACLKAAVEAPQGPVWIDIPKDVQGATV
jgi:acetolactate synthase-1/2/3 large subunit